jgi:hypothetical protein
MSDPLADDDERPLDPAAERIVARVRLMMLISALTTMVAVVAVLGVIGYRVFRGDGSIPPAAEVTALLPKGARVVSTALAADRLVITIDIGGALEIRTYDLQTLRPAGRLRFATEP